MIKDKLKKNLKRTLDKIGIKNVEPNIEIPSNLNFGDYSSSVALKLTKELKNNPLNIAQKIKDNLDKDDLIEKVEILKPGFINFWISKEYLARQAEKTAAGEFDIPEHHLGDQKKVMVEFAHPNTHKIFHIGHLRNITTGESIVRILEAVGNKIIRTNYQGDVGLHIAKCLYKLKAQSSNVKSLKTTKEKIEFIGKMYTEGSQAYETDEKAKEEILDINRKIYEKDPEILGLWEETRKWSLEYFSEIYKRVYTRFDQLYFESDMTKRGMEIVHEAVKNNILEKSEGAIIFDGKRYGIDTRVFINSLGFPTYEGKELALAEKEMSDFGELDKNIHCVTPEQTSFFKVTFKVEELIDGKKYKNKQYHLIYEWVNLKDGKMASRLGNIIAGDWILDKAKEKIIEKFKCEDKTAEILAVASVKYSFLKNSLKSAIAFDFDESISMEGNSGTYILYTYVRTQSLIKKSDSSIYRYIGQTVNSLNKDELILLRIINQFSEIVYNAAYNLSPNIVAAYLFNLCQKFNIFYQNCPILSAKETEKNFRLLITKSTGEIIKKGLDLLGIKTVDKM